MSLRSLTLALAINAFAVLLSPSSTEGQQYYTQSVYPQQAPVYTQQAPVYPQQTYIPSTYNYQQPNYGYSSYPANRDLLQTDVKNCTDLNCAPDQCCVETPRAAVCLRMIPIPAGAAAQTPAGTLVCPREKRCRNDADCFSAAVTNGFSIMPIKYCCVVNNYLTADTTCPIAPDYSKYPPQSQPGQVVPPKFGVCVPQAAANSPCVVGIATVATSVQSTFVTSNANGCPCAGASVCTVTTPGTIFGTCM